MAIKIPTFKHHRLSMPTLHLRPTPLASALRLVGGTLGLAIVPGVQAGTFIVNSLLEPGAGTPQDHCAQGNPNTCTLRDAINLANGDVDADTVIDLSNLQGTITLNSELSITNPNPNGLFIQGPGTKQLTISGNDTSRIFRLYSSSVLSPVVTISGLTLSRGYSDGNGAAIVSIHTELHLQNSVIENSHAGGRGGAIFSDADLTLSSSRISGNTASVSGGGIYGSNSNLDITASTINGNSAITRSGGGVYLDGASSVLLVNSSITGNTAADHGGGLYIGFNAVAYIESCTITDNQSGYSGGGVFFNPSSEVPASLNNTIVADNTFTATTIGTDLRGNFNGDYNFVGDSTGASLSGGTHNQTGNSTTPLYPLLGSLGYYGGPTPTKRPNTGSPVIGSGDCTTLPQPAKDQRDQSRSDGACDIGAVEVQTAEDTVFIGSFEAF